MSIGLKWSGDEVILINQDEFFLLLDFWAYWDQHFTGERVQLIGYNIDRFDIPFLEHRCAVFDLLFPVNYQSFDLMTFMYRLTGEWESFDKAAARFGIKRGNHIRGTDIPALFEAGDLESVVAHNTDDIRREWDLWEVIQKIQKGEITYCSRQTYSYSS